MAVEWDIATDPWAQGTTVQDPRLLHALGTLALAWNDCEAKLAELFSQVSHVDFGAFRLVAGDMTANQVQNRFEGWIKAEIAVAQPEDYILFPDEEELLRNLLKVFGICRENRNQLFHARPMTDRAGVVRLAVHRSPRVDVTLSPECPRS